MTIALWAETSYSGGVGFPGSGSGRTTEVDKRKAHAVAVALGGYRSRGGGRGSSRLLAQQNELARPFPRLCLPGLHWLRNQAPVRRRRLSQLRSLQLRPSTAACMGSGQTLETQASRAPCRGAQRLVTESPANCPH